MAISVAAMKRHTFSWGSQSNTVGSAIPITSTQTGTLKIYSDDAGASIGESVRGVLSRFLLTYDQTGGSIRALQGQLKVNTGIDVTSGIYTALQGYTELAATHSAKTGSTLSAIDASMEIGTALTVDSGGEACGVHVETTGSGTITNSGTCAGVLIDMASGAAKWPDGILIDGGSVLMGMRIGKFTSGGAVTNAVPFATTQDVYSDGQVSTMEAHGGSATNLGSGYCAKVGRFRHIVNCTTCAHETYGFMGQCVVKSTTLTHLHAGLIGTLECQTAMTVPTGVGANGYISASGILSRVGGATITVGSTGFCAGVTALSLATTVSITSGGVYAAFATCKTATGQAWGEAFYIQNALVAIRFAAADTNYLHGIKESVATPAGNTTHAMKVVIGTTAGYIPVYAAESF